MNFKRYIPKAFFIAIFQTPGFSFKLFTLILLFSGFGLTNQKLRAQGCGGGFGTPIFKETFGAGTSYGPALTVDQGFGKTNYSTGATNYIYWQPPPNPGYCNDGYYAILDNIHLGDGGNYGWITKTDHTGDVNGKMLIVNASYAPGTFYIRQVSGLCKNTNFLFSAWFINNMNATMCGGYLKSIPINIKFIVSDSLGNILDSASTGNIRPASNGNNQWQNFSFPINTGNYTTVYVQLVNNGPGGCGNDLAIDDISFQPCGPTATLSGPTGNVCIGNFISFNTKISAGYSTNYYQWQLSTDGGITWGDIAGANASSYSINSVSASQNGYQFRTLAAGSADNVKNPNCSVVSNIFTLNLSTPVLTFSSVPAQCVQGGSINLAPYASPAGGSFSGKGVTGNVLNLAAAGTGIDTIIYNYTSPTTNCTGSTVGYVTIQPNPVVKIAVTGSSSACYGYTVPLSIASGDHIQWYYNGKAISGATGTNYYASATGTYKAIVTSNGGCIGLDSTSITIFPNPNLQITGTSAICVGDTSTLKGNLVGSSYKWTLNHSQTLVGNTGTYKASSAGLYTLTIKDSNGCIDSASFTVTVNPLPTVANPQISGDTVICKGGTVSFGIFNLPNYVSFQWFKNGVSIAGATSNAYTAIDSGHYYIQVTDINGCKGKSRVIQVILAPSPTQPHVITSIPTSVCSPGTVGLSISPVAGLTYQWRRNGIALPNSNSPTYTASSTGTYSVLVANSKGCTALSDSAAVTIYAKPVASVSYTTLSSCNSVPIVLTVNPSPTAGDTYQWYKGGVLLAGQTGSTYSSTSTGTYNYVITNIHGCKDTSNSVTVTIYPTATVNIIADGPTTFCNPGVVTLESTSTFASYQWYLSGVPIPGATGSTYDATTGGTYTLHVVDVNGCAGTSATSIPVVVNPQTTPILTASGPTSFCNGGSVVLTATAAGVGTFSWFVNGKSIPSKYIVGNSYTATATGSYTVTYTNSLGCTGSSLPVSVVVNPLPTPAIQVGGTVQLCPPGSGNPPSTYVLHMVKPVVGSTYTWTLTDTLTHGSTVVSTGKNDSTYTVPTSGAVEGYYKVQETSSAGCIGFSDSVLIRLYKPPISGLQALTVCQGDSVPLYSPPGITFQWYYSPTGIAGSFVKASTYPGLGTVPDNQKIYKAADSGYYYVFVFDGNCYGTSATIQVRGLKPIVASIPAVAPFCQGTTTALNVAVTYPGPDVSGLTYRYQWYFLKSGGVKFDSIPGGIFNQIGADSSGTYKVVVSAKTAGKYCPAVVMQTTVVNQPIKPLITVGLKDSLCVGNRDTIKIQNQLSIISAPGIPSYQWYRNTVSLPGHTQDTLITTSSGNYYVIVTDGNGCVQNSDTVSLISVPAPKPSITSSGPTRFCKGGTDTIYTALQAGLQYQWYRKLKTASAYSAVLTVGGNTNRLAIIDSGIYKVVVTNTTGCIGVDSITIRVDSVPVVSLPSSITICPGSSQVLKVITKGSVQWSFGSLSNILSTADSISANLAGMYYVKVKNSANALCYSLDSVQVNFYAKPVMNFFSPSGCQKNDTIAFVNTSTISDGTAVNYVWNFGDPASGAKNTSTLSSPTHIYTTVGNYTVQLKGISIHGCTDSVMYTYSFLGTNPKSKFTIVASPSYCAGQGVSVRDTSTIALGTIAHYHWDVFTPSGVPAKVVTDTLKDISIRFPDTTATITYRIRETVTSKAGCFDTSSQAITIIGDPKVIYIAPQHLICVGSGLDSLKGGLPLNGTGGGKGVYSGAGVTAGVFNPVVAGVGKHAITYTFTPSAGVCPSFAVDTIQVLGQPTVTSFPKAGSINPCDTLVKLKVVGTGITSYEWFRNDTLIVGADSSIYMANKGGKYRARVINALGCYVDTSISFGLNPRPRSKFAVGSICQNLTVYFNNLSTISDKTKLSYQWNFGDGASAQNTSVVAMAHHQYPSVGTYTVTLIAQSITGCQDTMKLAITVNSVDSNANFTIKANMPYCTNESLIFVDSSSLPAGKVIKQYTWKFYDATGNLIKQDTGAEVPELFPIKGNLPQVYSAQEFLNTGDSCLTASPVKKFTINPITPLLYIREAPYNLCIYSNPFNLTGGSTIPGGQPGTGYYSGNGVVAQKTFSPQLAGVGNAIISYVFTNQYGCTNSVSTNYDVNDTIALTGSNLTVQEGTKVTLNGIGALPFTFGPNGISSINADSLKWNWSPALGLSSSTDTTPSFVASNSINYTLTVTSPKGCISRAEFQIHVKLNLFLPTSFSPNGDGIHDTWHIKGIENYPNAEVYIFNRWGEQLWYSKGYPTEYDGYYKGKPLPAGTYYYLLKFNQDGLKPANGPVTLIY